MTQKSWSQRLAEKQAEKERKRQEELAKTQPPAPEPGKLSAAVPEVEKSQVPEHIANSDAELDKYIENIGIIEAYVRWCGKMKPNVLSGQVESIMISCPVPGHEDRNPSAWVNTDKGTWYCASCGRGGDKLDIAAFRYGISDYKTGSNGKAFHDLRRAIGKEAGWEFVSENGMIRGKSPAEQQAEKQAIMDQAQADFDAAQAEKVELVPIDMGDAPAEPSSPAPVIDLETGDEVLKLTPKGPQLNWEPLVKPGTFLDSYMKAVTVDPSPEEFHFWNAMMALGLSVGRQVYGMENSAYYSNIFVCILGGSGSGKSRARYPFKRVLEEALPYDKNGPGRNGVLMVPRAGSGENLVRKFAGTWQKDAKSTPIDLGNVKGYIDFDELSDMLGRSGRLGSTMKPTLMSLYDMPTVIDNSSNTGGTDEARNFYASLTTSVQPELLRALLTKDDISSGFLNRFVFCVGTQKPKPAVSQHEYSLTETIEKLKEINTWANSFPGGLKLQFTEESLNEFTTWYNDMGFAWADNHPGILSRLDFTIKKLILLFSINSMEEEISVESVQYATAMYQYLVASYAMVDDKIRTSETGELENAILKVIESHQTKGPKWVGIPSIMRNKKWERGEVVKALKTMATLGELIEVTDPPPQGRGRPIKGKAYMPNPEAKWLAT